MIFDSHCHLEEGMPHDIDLVMNIGCDIKSSFESLEWTKKEDRIYGTVGIHPEFADEATPENLAKIKALATENDKIKAIGEIGLDYHWDDNPPKEVQRKCFEDQIELAIEIGMPICIHSRDADQETLDILKAHSAFSKTRVLMHCFSGSVELAKEYIKLGAWISFAGPLTYKNNRKTVAVAEFVPVDKMLVETDSPYLSPEPKRGKPNCPENVIHTIQKIADIKQLTFEEVANHTFENGCTFYGIKNN
ncbi:MAG: TatD family hydrolase [Bacillota bacterium]|nr:TatD family hydrolase [Bacillota bacterium]